MKKQLKPQYFYNIPPMLLRLPEPAATCHVKPAAERAAADLAALPEHRRLAMVPVIFAEMPQELCRDVT